MIRHKPWIEGIHRLRGEKESRLSRLRLDKNERVTPLPKKFFRELLQKVESNHFTAYPETECLYEMLAKHHGVKTSNIVLTSGSDAAIKHGFELFVNPGDEVITLEPTFAMVEIYCNLFGANRIAIGYDHDLRLDLPKLLDNIGPRVSLVVIANPNSPTGTYIANTDVEEILIRAAGHGVPVLIDEAYFGFYSETVMPLLAHHGNLIVTRSFSKAAGLAGLRIGYMVASAEVAQLLYKFRPMYEVNTIGVLAAIEILKHPEIVQEYITATGRGRKYLIDYLSQHAIHYRDTVTNFIHIDFVNRKDQALIAFEKRGAIVSGGLPVSGYENYLRITLGPPEAMQVVIDIIKDLA